jgi:hypothetical protein
LISGAGAAAPVPDAGAPAAPRPIFYDRPIAGPDLVGRSLEELHLMQDTIYARAGRRFADPKRRDYFARQPWYAPSDGGLTKLGAVDKANVRAIAEHEKRFLVERDKQHLAAQVTVPCPKVGPDGKPVRARLEEELSAVARSLKWDSDYGPPTSCHRRLELVCGPDIDGDGQPEAIVHITWRTVLNGRTCRTIRDDNDYWDTGVTLLVSGRLGKWRAVAPLGVDIAGDQQVKESNAWFMRRRDGEIVVRSSWTNVASDTTCRFGQYTIWRLIEGKLVALETVDDSWPCPGP